MFWLIISSVLLFIYFYFRLGEESSIRLWIDKNAIQIGNGFILLWLAYFFITKPTIALYYGLPLLGIIAYTTIKRYKKK